MMMAGKSVYVPPHMRNRPSTPVQDAMPSKYNQLKMKKTKGQIKKAKKPMMMPVAIMDDTKVKPHCELFLADLPAPMRSVTTLAGFFHPYGEIANIQIIPVGQKFPEECHKFLEVDQFENTFCAIIEFLTARVAKFVVGVLRKRIEALNFRIGLLKPGLAEEMAIQDGRIKESMYMPSFQINTTQEAMLSEKHVQSYSSEELSEVELKQSRNKRSILRITNPSDPAYWTGSSGISSGSGASSASDIDSDQKSRPISESSDDDDCDLLALALKNGIKTTQKVAFRRSDKPTTWRGLDEMPRRSQSQSNFQAWNKKELAKKEKKEDKVVIKPHCELFLTNLPPQMRTIAGLAAFFHPYGEVAQIQIVGPKDSIPEGVKKWCNETDLEQSNSAIVEFLTARTAKFVVGVLRKRLAQLNFRVGLIKPGLGDELTYQRNTYGDIVYQPSSGLSQQYIVTKTVITDTSSDSSEVDVRPPLKRIVKRLVTANRMQMDQAYWSQSSSTLSSSENSNISSSESDPPSDCDHRSGSPISESSSVCDKIAEIDELVDELTGLDLCASL